MHLTILYFILMKIVKSYKYKIMTRINLDDEFYTIELASEKLGMSERALREKISSGEIKGYKKGKRYYLLHSDILKYITNDDK